MGVLGLGGFILAAIGGGKAIVMAVILLGIILWGVLKRSLPASLRDLNMVVRNMAGSSRSLPVWMPAAALLGAGLSLLLALAPPIEAFDALLYHLTVPSWWLRDGGIRLIDLPHYWFPSLLEGMFFWPIGLGNDTVPQYIHYTFGLLTALIAWQWANSIHGPRAAWWSVILIISMPSLPLVAAWAYTDLGLVFYSLSALYAFWKWRTTTESRWLVVTGIMSGFALGIKYTSVVLPIALTLLLAVWERKNLWSALGKLLVLLPSAFLTALPWYLRNLAWTGNPVYPFILGGPFWDASRASWYAGAGTGIGWNARDLLLLPYTFSMGYRDVNYFDGRVGPFYLILFPLVLWVLWRTHRERSRASDSYKIIAAFSGLGILFWTYGVIQTDHLFQARLLWPALIPLTIPMAVGILDLDRLDSPRVRLGFVFSTLAALVVLASLFDFGLLVTVRNPLAVALGMETRQSYMERLQPDYNEALSLIKLTPPNAFIYLIKEPRSYGMDRRVQPDPINDNLEHDLYVHRGDVSAVIQAWRQRGYTHILISKRGLSFDGVDPVLGEKIGELQDLLELVDESPGQTSVLYRIPPH